MEIITVNVCVLVTQSCLTLHDPWTARLLVRGFFWHMPEACGSLILVFLF